MHWGGALGIVGGALSIVGGALSIVGGAKGPHWVLGGWQRFYLGRGGVPESPHVGQHLIRGDRELLQQHLQPQPQHRRQPRGQRWSHVRRQTALRDRRTCWGGWGSGGGRSIGEMSGGDVGTAGGWGPVYRGYGAGG